MPASIVAAYRHKFSGQGDEGATRRLSKLLTQPALAALKRVWYRVKDKEKAHESATQAQVFEYLRLPDAHAVGLDSGRGGDLVAAASFEIATPHTPDPDVVAPLLSWLVVPYDPEQRDALLNAFVGIAEVLRSVWGMTSVEANFDVAQLAALAKGPPRDQRAAYPLLTDDRIRYRRSPWYFDKKIDRAIGGPEWGTFLGPGHLETISAEKLRRSGAFFEVRELATGGAFLRLSEDPIDAQDDGILGLVTKGRAALEPIVLDVSAVKL